ncbi:MAG: chemotaxis protein CheW [Pseudomonadota bacterium]
MDWTGKGRASVRFDVRGVDCYLSVEQVREVLITPPITRVFRSAPFVHGVVNIRGEVIPVLDPGMLLGIGAKGVPTSPRMLVLLEVEDLVVALGSGGEVGVRPLQPEELSAPPVDLSIDARDCVLSIVSQGGTARGPGLLLDGQRILSLPPLEAMRSGAEQA